MGSDQASSTDKPLSEYIMPTCFGEVPVRQQNYPTNQRKSTRYNIFTFLPMTFLYQLSRVINLFYLLNALLQSIDAISTNSPLVSFIPTVFIMIVGVIRELIVEISRWKDDNRINAIPVKKLSMFKEKKTEVDERTLN